VRHAHPTWGPVKVRAWLERREPRTRWPAASTIGVLFERAGLTVRRKLRRRATPSSAPFAACGAANDVWCIDFKGWFLTGDGTPCAPPTLSDAHSRYLLRCQVLGRDDTEHVWPVLDAAFREYGLPVRLRSDNGPPFASTGAGGLSRLAVKVIKAGVRPERIAPGKPQQNGRLERLHLMLLRDTAQPRRAACASSSTASVSSGASTTRSGRMRRSATMPRPSTMPPRRGAGTGCCASRRIRPSSRSGACAPTARFAIAASRPTSTRRSPANRSASSSAKTAAGSSASAPSRSASSTIAAIACDGQSRRPVDLWIILTDYPQPHRPNNRNNRHERFKKTVTHVVGQNCHPCSRLLRGPDLIPGWRAHGSARSAARGQAPRAGGGAVVPT